MLNFKKSVILVLMGIFIIVFSTASSYAQKPPGHGKGEKKGWTGDRPPGWEKGKKAGWGEGDVPPGLEKGEKRGWTKEEKVKEKAREMGVKAEEEETEVLEEQKEQETEALEEGKPAETEEIPVTKGKKGGEGKGKEKGEAWWKFWEREKEEAE